jgi:HMG (high mobility group) box
VIVLAVAHQNKSFGMPRSSKVDGPAASQSDNPGRVVKRGRCIKCPVCGTMKRLGQRKQVASAFIFFCKDNRPQVTAALQAEDPRVSPQTVMRELARLWRGLSPDELAVYKEDYEKRRMVAAGPPSATERREMFMTEKAILEARIRAEEAELLGLEDA